MVVNFKAPSVAPENEDEEDNYAELEALINSGIYIIVEHTQQIHFISSQTGVLSTVVVGKERS